MPKSINMFIKEKFSEKNPEEWEKKFYVSYFISHTFFTPKSVLLSEIRLWMARGETLARTHYRFYSMNSIYYKEQRIENMILKYKDDLGRKVGELIFKYPEFRNR